MFHLKLFTIYTKVVHHLHGEIDLATVCTNENKNAWCYDQSGLAICHLLQKTKKQQTQNLQKKTKTSLTLS